MKAMCFPVSPHPLQPALCAALVSHAGERSRTLIQLPLPSQVGEGLGMEGLSQPASVVRTVSSASSMLPESIP